VISLSTKAQELIKWFKENGKQETGMWDIEVDWFDPHDYIDDTFELTSQNRWTTWQTAVWKFEDGSYVQIHWEKGSTEYQDCYPNISIVEVEPYEKTIIDYRAIK
jgi:hypothetical protein